MLETSAMAERTAASERALAPVTDLVSLTAAPLTETANCCNPDPPCGANPNLRRSPKLIRTAFERAETLDFVQMLARATQRDLVLSVRLTATNHPRRFGVP